jgi:tetratricopeptide (TPR) repeat protein
MTDAGRAAIVRFVGDLKRLRQRAGSPSLNRLVALTANLPRPLPRSTISDKLNARSVPEWEFVTSYVTACAAHAVDAGQPLPADAVDLTRWSALHLRMLQTVDNERATGRLADAGRAEAARRWSNPSMVPRQLPAAPRFFAGRADALAALDRVAEEAAVPGRTVVISAIGGTAGIGKTALAVYWAHRVADQFPDGQLYLNLRGFGPGEPLAPTDALGGFLDAFAVPGQEIPTTLDGQAGLYRSLLAPRRMLVVLDNARDAEQVRPLLPGSPGCLVLVTSRHQLTGLVVVEGAHSLTLDPLTPAEARSVLAGRLGADRVAAEPEAVDRIVAVCAGLPLVLAIMAARAASHSGFPLCALTGELGSAGGLDAYAGGVDVRTVFSWSYHALDAAAARLFRLLGLCSGPDIGLGAAAALAGLPTARARRILTELTDAHLLNEHAPGRFTVHDLLRAYAGELAVALDSEADRHTAIHRVLDYYLYSADQAASMLDPRRPKLDLPTPVVGVIPEEILGAPEATAWFTVEHRVLLSAVVDADAGFDAHASGLAGSLATFLYRRGYWPDWVAVQRIGLQAAQRCGDRPAQAQAHRGLARAYLRLDREREAHFHLQRALVAYRELGDDVGQAHTQLNLCEAFDWYDQHEMTLRHARLALELYQAAGHRPGQAKALNSIGWSQAQLGDHQQAVTFCRQALAVQMEIGDRDGAADTLDSLGFAHHRLGDHDQARACYQWAAALFREAANHFEEANTLDNLGDACHSAGDPDAARAAWADALRLLDPMGAAERLDRIRAKLGRSAGEP